MSETEGLRAAHEHKWRLNTNGFVNREGPHGDFFVYCPGCKEHLTVSDIEAALRGSVALQKRLEAAENALRIADVHLGWSDASLENVHRIVRAALALNGRYSKGRRDDAHRRALNMLDDWVDVTGFVQRDTGYYYELQAVVEDAVECGAQAALGIRERLEGESGGDKDRTLAALAGEEKPHE